MYTNAMKVGILGASGYTGAELLRLLVAHPHLEVAVATAHTHAGELVGGHTPALAAAYPGLVYEEHDPGRLDGLDVVFCALPHGESQRVVPELRGRVGLVVDLAADFRLRDPSLYPLWYGEEHGAPELLAEAAYGLPELFRDELVGATLVAAAGCYPTAAGVALAPLVRRGLVERAGIIVDAASGVSGAGRGPKESLHFGTVDEDFTAYGLLTHRHTPEMEQILGCTGAVHPPSRPHGARHPGHLLRAPRCGMVRSVDGRGHGRAARGLRRRAVRRGPRRTALHQGHGGLQRGARDGAGGRSDRVGGHPVRP